MDRYDLYDERLLPGDTVVLQYGQLGPRLAQITHISAKGTIYFRCWEGAQGIFTARVEKTRTCKIIKLTPEMGVQTN